MDTSALNDLDMLKKSVSIVSRVQFAGSNTNSLPGILPNCENPQSIRNKIEGSCSETGWRFLFFEMNYGKSNSRTECWLDLIW